MKKLVYISLLAIATACGGNGGGDPETPPTPPTPGTGDIASLTDNNIETCYESDGANVAIELENKGGGDVVAYSLYSSGVTTEKDPKAWTLLGSDDKQDWKQIETRTDQTFCARYQEHLFKLGSVAKYKYYRFELQPTGGKTLRLAEVKFHSTDPDAGWNNFVYPSIIFQDKASDTKGSQYYSELVQNKQAYLQYHAKAVAKLLYFTDQDKRTEVKTITYSLENRPGEVSAKSGSVPNISIMYSTDWIEKSYASSMFKLDYETKGVLFHEMTHAFQLEPKGIPPYSQPNTAWQITEGMADAIRIHAGFLPMSNRKPGGYWQDGYQTTGFFLEWLTTKDPDALRKINASLLTLNPWSFDGAMEYTFGKGTTTDDLWNEYQKYLKSL